MKTLHCQLSRRIYILGFLILAGSLFQGCISKKYVRPTVVAENAVFRESAGDQTNFSDISWQNYYKDANLIKLINHALDSNFNILTAQSNIRIAQEYLKQSKAAFYPGVGGSVSAGVSAITNSEGNLSATGTYSMLFQTIYNGTQASWEIDIWGKLAAAKRSQQAQLLQSEAYYNVVKTELVANIASAYFALMAYDAQLKIYESSALTRESSLEVIKALKEAAQVNEIAVNQAAAQYYYAMTQIPQIKINIQMTENMLSALLGLPPGEITRSSLLDADFADVDFLKIGIPGQLLANRPDILAAEYQLISAHETWNYSRAAMYPSLVLSAGVGFQAADFAKWFAFPASFVGDLIGSLSAPIFNHRKLKTQKNVSYENKLQAADNFKNCLINAQKEVADAYITYIYSTESIQHQQKQKDELLSAVNSSAELLKSGYTSYLDLLYAEDNALTASIGLVNIYLQNAKSKIELYRSLGGGWK